MKTLAPVLVLTMQLFLLQAPEGIEFYVAANGSDDHPRSQSRPFATLERARDDIRKRKQQGSLAESVTVHPSSDFHQPLWLERKRELKPGLNVATNRFYPMRESNSSRIRRAL